MSENILTKGDIKSNILIFYVLAFATFVYLLLLILLNAFGAETDPSISQEPVFEVILPGIFAIVSIGQIFIVKDIFLPRIESSENLEEAFPEMLIATVLLEAIAIYGLLIGQLDLFASNIPIRWYIVVPFLLVSFFSQYYLIQDTHIPKLNKLLGTPYNPPS